MHGQLANLLLGGVLTAAVLALADQARAEDPLLRRDLEAVARRTVFFGHQSVGTNILDGVRDLAAQEGVPLRVYEVRSAREATSGGIAHGFMDRNGDAPLKLESFARALGPGPAPVEVAVLKFCFVDVTEAGDAKRLFARYQQSVRALQAAHPRTTFVHATVPLTIVPTGPKAFVKRLLGRERTEFDNARREEFNALLRGAYQGREPMFDLARLEATRSDGQLATYPVGGAPVPMLVPAYTDDGGHLNETGRRRVARELLRVVAALPKREAAATPTAR